MNIIPYDPALQPHIFQSIRTHTLSYTETKPSRVVATAAGGTKVIISSHHTEADHLPRPIGIHLVAASKLCEKLGWNHLDFSIGHAHNDDGYVFVRKEPPYILGTLVLLLARSGYYGYRYIRYDGMMTEGSTTCTGASNVTMAFTYAPFGEYRSNRIVVVACNILQDELEKLPNAGSDPYGIYQFAMENLKFRG